jgi:small subunit ribosomal protein S16
LIAQLDGFDGAQPTDTAKAILSYRALLKHHLDGGIRKGALTQEQADAKSCLVRS